MPLSTCLLNNYSKHIFALLVSLEISFYCLRIVAWLLKWFSYAVVVGNSVASIYLEICDAEYILSYQSRTSLAMIIKSNSLNGPKTIVCVCATKIAIYMQWLNVNKAKSLSMLRKKIGFVNLVVKPCFRCRIFL